jgi:hypothetical protein
VANSRELDGIPGGLCHQTSIPDFEHFGWRMPRLATVTVTKGLVALPKAVWDVTVWRPVAYIQVPTVPPQNLPNFSPSVVIFGQVPRAGRDSASMPWFERKQYFSAPPQGIRCLDPQDPIGIEMVCSPIATFWRLPDTQSDDGGATILQKMRYPYMYRVQNDYYSAGRVSRTRT